MEEQTLSAQEGLCATVPSLQNRCLVPTAALSPSRSFLVGPGYWYWQVGWLRGCV